jgi:hypothetical protein
VHQDYIAAVLNGLRVGLAVGIVGLLAVLSGLPGANSMILGTIVFVSLGSVLHDPLAMGSGTLDDRPEDGERTTENPSVFRPPRSFV